MSDKIRLPCWILGYDITYTFAVEVHKAKRVEELEDEIVKKINSKFHEADTSHIKLWNLPSPILLDEFDERLGGLTFTSNPAQALTARKLSALSKISRLWPNQPDVEENVHIIVQTPSPAADPWLFKMASMVGDVLTRVRPRAPEPISNVRSSKRPRLGMNDRLGINKPRRDVTNNLLTRWSEGAERLPSLTELQGLLDSPLSEDEKVPISADYFEELLFHQPHDHCDRDDLDILFRVCESETSFSLLTPFVSAITSPTPPDNGTESSFIMMWDEHIRKILSLLLPNGVSIRGSSLHTSTQKLRPDFGFLLGNVCLFRGEEKSPIDSDDPKADLSDKLTWTYSPAPYIFAYHAVGADVTLSVICAPQRPSEKPYVEDLAASNLRLRRERIVHLRRIIRISRYIPLLLKLVGYRNDPEFVEIIRDRKSIQIGLKSVKKTYYGRNAKNRVRYLEHIYKMLKHKQAPHVDYLARSVDTTVYLEPKGIVTLLSNEKELLDALVCVLETLQVLHQDPPLFHRDIRWPNVIRRADDNSLWFLIDWEDAAGSNNIAATHLHSDSHSPRVYSDNHGGEVDIWEVGLLIKECRSSAFNISADVLELGTWMQDKQPTPQDTLKAIKKYRDNFGLAIGVKVDHSSSLLRFFSRDS